MGKKARISNESVNCYGTRVLTSGVDLSQYERNPVLLYMHERGSIVGLVKNLKVEGQDIVGEPVFDCATELSQTLKKQWEFGSLRMVSANFEVLDTSKDEALVMEGQTRETVTRAKLIEVSMVDIGGNDDAIVLSRTHEGKQMTLAKDGDPSGLLPLLDKESNNPLKQEKMELKDLAIKLGLKETATEEEVNAKLASLNLAAGKVAALESQVQTLQGQQEQMQLAAITSTVEDAIAQKRLAANLKDHFVELGKKMSLDSLKMTLSAMQPQGKLSMVVGKDSQGRMIQLDADDFSQFKKLSEVPQDRFMKLRHEHRDQYIALYKAEFGFEPQDMD